MGLGAIWWYQISSTLFTLIFIGLFLIPFSFAQDNSTEVLSDDSSYSDIYFDASLTDDNGDGSKENPYKYLHSSRIKDNSNIHLADGLYELDSSTTVYNYNAFMGESMENTIITYNKAGYLFSNRGTLILNNLTIKGASIYNTNTLIADNVIFRDSNSDYGGHHFVLFSGAGNLMYDPSKGQVRSYKNVNKLLFYKVLPRK